jgi:membrane associated rhomboid family serine protease
MRQASVGFHCPECVREGARSTRQPRTAYGGLRQSASGRATLGLIAANVVVFLLVAATGGSTSDLLTRLWLLPADSCGRRVPGLGCVEQIQGVAGGAWWQLLTTIFTHVDLWHIGFNMVALYILGPQLELLLGRARFLALYLLSGLVGSAAVYWLAGEHAPTVGASGALFGLMAALLIVAVRVRGNVQGLMVLVGINLVITVLGRGFISWQGHLGGFVGGLLLALVLAYAPRRHRTVWQVAGLTLVAVAVVAAVAARTLVLTA